MVDASDYSASHMFKDDRGEETPCQACSHPSYNFFQVWSKCNDIRLEGCIWRLTTKDRDLCNFRGHKTVLEYEETIESLRKMLMEAQNTSELHVPLEHISIPVKQGPSSLEQRYWQCSRKKRKFAALEEKRNSNGGEGGDYNYVRVKRRRRSFDRSWLHMSLWCIYVLFRKEKVGVKYRVDRLK